MARGSRGQSIFADDTDRKRFLKTVDEACQRTGWLIHAYVLMGNHYHLLIETPEGNLVPGMKWLQSTYTQRYNHRHRLTGHLFQGRYKAIIIDEREPMYLQTVSTYIHLNPARAGLVRIGEQPLKRYRWSSYPWYLNRAGKKPAWLRREHVMGALGLAEHHGRGYETYIESRVLELGTRAGRTNLEAQWKELRRGWFVGGNSFAAKLTENLKKAVRGRQRESHSGPARQAHDQMAAELILARGLRALGLDENALLVLPKGAQEKSALAWWLRENTTVTLRWASERLGMGHYTRVSHAVSQTSARPDRKLEKLKRLLGSIQDLFGKES
jgi:putative transposase